MGIEIEADGQIAVRPTCEDLYIIEQNTDSYRTQHSCSAKSKTLRSKIDQYHRCDLIVMFLFTLRRRVYVEAMFTIGKGAGSAILF